MVNYVQEGDTLTLTAPYDVVAGAGALVGIVFGVSSYDVLSGALGEFATEGVFDLAKDTSTFAEGAAVYWDNTAKKCTSTASGNTKIGAAAPVKSDGTSALGASSGDSTVRIRLNGSF